MRASFVETARDGQARCGVVTTARGEFTTPRFMPVGTRGAIVHLDASDVEALGAQVILANTYHLMMRPGADVVETLGGIHGMADWDGHVLTDSGGYQIFSLGPELSDDGATFKSTYDGSTHLLTPEGAVDVQAKIGADIQMVLDVCPSSIADLSVVRSAVERTGRWAERGRAAFLDHPDAARRQCQFGIVQGGCFPHLRRESARAVADFDLPGIAVGGVSVGEPVEEMHRIVRDVTPLLPDDRPRYLMGIGTLREMAMAVANGIDLFDCVLPTRLGRHGTALVGGERWNLRNARFRHDHTPLDPSCSCVACTGHTRAYLHHLIRSEELLGLTLLSIHNITQLVRFTTAMGQAIRDGCFSEDFAPWEPDSPARHTW